MSNNPLVSIIIPNYCHADYLDERINSVLNQTYHNFEVIILDDCSPDNGASKAIIEKYRSNPHVSHIVYNEVNSGSTFRQWHKGIDLAQGDLIWIAESDDKCELTLLEELSRYFVEDDTCVLAYCISARFSDKYGILDYSGTPGNDIKFDGIKYIRKYMCHRNSILNASSALFRKKAALTINKQYDKYKGAGDHLFWVEIAECGNVVMVNKALNYQRLHGCNSTKRFNTTGVNQKEDKQILDYIFKNGYITKMEFFCRKIQYAYDQILFWDYENENIKADIIKFWKLSRFDMLCTYLYKYYILSYTKLSELYHKIHF